MSEMTVFKELLAVVAGDDDGSAVAVAFSFESVEEPTDAGVNLPDRRLVQRPERLQRPVVDFPAQPGSEV